MAKYVKNAAVPETHAAQLPSGTRAERERASGSTHRRSEPGSHAGDGQAGEDFSARIAGHARQLFDDEVSQRFSKGASDLGRLADALRGASTRLDGAFGAPYFERAAGHIEQLAELVKHAKGTDVIDGVQRFARERPLLYLGGAVALGIGAGRFLKSSSIPALPSQVGAQQPARRAPRNKSNQASQR